MACCSRCASSISTAVARRPSAPISSPASRRARAEPAAARASTAMRALFPGSFDPPHLGHLDLIRRAAALLDELVVGVAGNPDKQAFLAVDERIALLRADCAALATVRVVGYQGATTTFAAANGCGVLVRGLRNAGDLEAEQAMAEINRGHGLDTLLLPARSQLL